MHPVEVRYPDGQCERYEYNALGLPHTHTKGRAVTRWRYTPRGLPLQEQDPYYRTRHVDYDQALRPIGLINENHVRWHFQWNDADQLQEETRFDGLTRRYHYNARGQLERLIELGIEESADKTSPSYWTPPTVGAANDTTTHRNQSHSPRTALPEDQRPRRETRFNYDARGRMVARVSEDYQDTVHYDDRDQLTLIEREPTEIGRTKGLHSSRLCFEYDQAGRLIGEGEGDRALAYAYDALDNLTALTLPDGRQLKSFYYGSGHLLQLNLDELEISHFERDDLHREIMRTQGALTSRFGFDTRGRKHWQFASPLDSRTLSPHHSPNVLASDLVEREDNTVYRRYHYTAAGELERVEDKTRPDQRFDYDRTGRLKRHWPAPMREEWFGYDEAANRILPGNDCSPAI